MSFFHKGSVSGIIPKRSSISLTDLPSNVLVEILARLPLRTLMVARSVCKSFVFLTTSNPHFINLHSSYADQILVFQFGTFESPSPLLCMSDQVPDCKNSQLKPLFQLPNMKHNYKNPRLKPLFLPNGTHLLHSNTLFLVNSCNGLLYFMQNGIVEDYRSLVCNPITSEYIIIPDVAPKKILHTHTQSLWLGFSPGTEQYKVLRIFLRQINIDSDKFAAQVYVIGSDSWRDIDDTLPHGRHFFRDLCQTQLANGLMYLHSTLWSSVISFDFEREKFGEVALPPEFQDKGFSITKHFTNIGVLGGCLCLSCNDGDANRVGLWVMRKCGNRDSWTKDFVFYTSVGSRGGHVNGCFKPLQFLGNGEILMLWRTNTLVSYDPRTKTLTYFMLHGTGERKAVTLTPSFVPLKDTLKVETLLSRFGQGMMKRSFESLEGRKHHTQAKRRSFNLYPFF